MTDDFFFERVRHSNTRYEYTWGMVSVSKTENCFDTYQNSYETLGNINVNVFNDNYVFTPDEIR